MKPAAWLLACLAGTAAAHPAPSSMLRLEFAPRIVHAEYWVPVSELEYARAADPGGGLPAYLLRHLGAKSPGGAPWEIAVNEVRETTYLDHPYLVATLALTPPAGETAGDFVLVTDAITHEVRNHVVYVTARRGAGTDLLGALQYPARNLRIAAP